MWTILLKHQESVCKPKEKKKKSAAAAFNACKLQEHGESRQAWQIFSSTALSQRQAEIVPDSDSSDPARFGSEMALAVFDFWVYLI